MARKKERQRLIVEKVPLGRKVDPGIPRFEPMPIMYLELFENKDKVKPSEKDKEYLPDDIMYGLNSYDQTEALKEADAEIGPDILPQPEPLPSSIDTDVEYHHKSEPDSDHETYVKPPPKTVISFSQKEQALLDITLEDPRKGSDSDNNKYKSSKYESSKSESSKYEIKKPVYTPPSSDSSRNTTPKRSPKRKSTDSERGSPPVVKKKTLSATIADGKLKGLEEEIRENKPKKRGGVLGMLSGNFEEEEERVEPRRDEPRRDEPRRDEPRRDEESDVEQSTKVPGLAASVVASTIPSIKENFRAVNIAPTLSALNKGVTTGKQIFVPQPNQPQHQPTMDLSHDVSGSDKDEQSKKKELLWKFKMLRKQYKNVEIPEFSEYTDYNTMKSEYDDIVRQLYLDSCVETYTKYLTIGFFVLEYALVNFLNFREIEGFTQNQMISMNQYEKILLEIGEKQTVQMNNQWSPELRLLGIVLMNSAVFVATKMLFNAAGNIGGSKPAAAPSAGIGGIMSSLSGLFGGGGGVPAPAAPSSSNAPGKAKRKMGKPDMSDMDDFDAEVQINMDKKKQ